MTAQDLKQFTKVMQSEFQVFAKQNRKERRAELSAELSAFAKQNRKERHTDLAQFTKSVLLPAMETMIDNKLEEKLQPLLVESSKQINESRFVSKDYCDGRRSDLRGDVLAARKRDSARVDAHIKIHHRKGHLTDSEVKKLDKIRDFAPLLVKI